MVNEAERLLADYTFYWLHTSRIMDLRAQGAYVRGYKATPERIALFEEMIGWCRGRGIDPRLWLYTLFRARRWFCAPQLKRGHLMSAKMIGRYREIRCLDGYRQHILEERASDAYDPNRDLNGTIEARKRYYVESGQAERCLRELPEMLGFHPHSSACAACPQRFACRQTLEGFVSFDVIALREGRLTAEQAMAQVRRARGI